VRSFAIVTTEPNELCAALHNRMPVVLAPEAWPAWIGEEPAGEAQLKSLLAPTLPTAWFAGRSASASATSGTTIRAWSSRLFCLERAAMRIVGDG
jgi:putative SOS response-associated peptidase YedK